MKIAIRADGGSKIGMGHIMRTLVLAKELAKTNEVFYICRVDKPLTGKYSPGIKKIKLEGFNVIGVDEDSIIEELKRVTADCLITDSYDVDEYYFNETKQLFNKTGYIDDMNMYYFNVDFLINQNINAKDLVYRVNKNTKLLLGTDYIMLREEFRHALKKNIKEEVKDILITLGGADPFNVTELILNYIHGLKYTYHVVVGPSFGSVNTLKIFEAENENIKLYFNANMIELMERCDIAISACGSTLYELSACGVPTLGIVMADNQLGINNSMKKNNLILDLGWYDNLNRKKFIKRFNLLLKNKTLRENMSQAQQSFINKNGALKLANRINELIKSRYRHSYFTS